MSIMKFNSLLDAAAYLLRAGYSYDTDYDMFVRGSWHARIRIQKNGLCRVLTS